MTNLSQKTVLCITSYEKGQEFMRACKRLGSYVILLTVTTLENAHWPHESIDELFYMPDLSKVDDVIRGVSFLARSRIIDCIIALDDYDVLTAAALREHLCIEAHDTRWSEQVLRDFGNVSSSSVFFVLESAFADSAMPGYWWMCSFGAGFTCHGALLEVG